MFQNKNNCEQKSWHIASEFFMHYSIMYINMELYIVSKKSLTVQFPTSPKVCFCTT